MKNRKVIRGEKHHWWPIAVSRYWENEKGQVNRLDVNESLISSSGKEFAKISDGHNVIFSESSVWNSTIEHYFDEPDTNFPKVIDWLQSLNQEEKNIIKIADDGIIWHDYTDEMLDMLRECLISLVVRSLKYRNSQVKYIESLRGELPKKEAKQLITANINQKYKILVQNSKGMGKFAILFTYDKEFIFGDGCYSNIGPSSEHLINLKMLIPLTPNMAVIWAIPMAYRTPPRLISKKITPSIVELINQATQIYSKDYLFYKSEKPKIIQDFKLNEHRIYNYETDPIAKMINSLIPDEIEKRYRRDNTNTKEWKKPSVPKSK